MEVAEKDSQRIKRVKYYSANATETGNVDAFVNFFRVRLEFLGVKSFDPSPRHVRRATAEIVVNL